MCDQLPSFLIKDYISCFEVALCVIFNRIMENIQNVSSFKSGNRSDVTNYPATAIIPNLAKMLESIVVTLKLCNHIANTVSLNNVVSLADVPQVQIFVILLSLYQIPLMKEIKLMLYMYTDFSKAFDLVSHQLLINKLHTFGVWIIRIRRNIVVLNHVYNYVTFSWIIQGSNLGPFMLLIFTNEIC